MDHDLYLDKLIASFEYCVQPTDISNEIMEEFRLYIQENEKFMKRFNVSAGKRARKHLLNIFHLARARRKEISTEIYKEEEDAS